MIKLVEPNKTMLANIEEYKLEFLSNNEIINGALGLIDLSAKDWITFVENSKQKDTVKEGYVTAHTFLIMNDNDLVGIINARHDLNDYLFNFGGHIGYSIRKSKRGNGYAKEALKQACEFLFSSIGLEKILVTCDKNNIASKKTIEYCGGILENEIPKADSITLRYWIYRTK